MPRYKAASLSIVADVPIAVREEASRAASNKMVCRQTGGYKFILYFDMEQYGSSRKDLSVEAMIRNQVTSLQFWVYWKLEVMRVRDTS